MCVREVELFHRALRRGDGVNLASRVAAVRREAQRTYCLSPRTLSAHDASGAEVEVQPLLGVRRPALLAATPGAARFERVV